MKRVVASVVLILFGFVLGACGAEGDKQGLNGAFGDTEELSTAPDAVDNSGSEGDQEDGRMLKPEGHKGLWFETEPEDPWEHYVWVSQKFVGDPIELSRLESEGPYDDIAGQPDVCDEQVLERMKEVGFERVDLDLRTTGMDFCYLKEIDPTDWKTAGNQLTAAYYSLIDLENLTRLDDNIGNNAEVQLYELADRGDGPICVVRTFDDPEGLYYSFSEGWGKKDDSQTCRRALMSYTIFHNIFG